MKKQNLIILTSPPASGKTYWINSFQEEIPHEKLLIISPLRALADECRGRWGDKMEFMTPEEWMMKKPIHQLVIFDEFHLFFYWGDTFRPLMWEVFFEISQSAEMVFLLTATLSIDMQNEVRHFGAQFDQIYWLNQGNQILKFYPTRYIKAPDRNWLLHQIKTTTPKTDVNLVFCKYREEVFSLEKELTESGYVCLSCVGGESKYMADNLKKVSAPDFIISTTVLSHGVNLPRIKRIYFTYQVQNLDFWIQMVARGGRRGEGFEVYALEKPHGLNWNPLINFMLVAWLSLKQKFSRRTFCSTPFDFG